MPFFRRNRREEPEAPEVRTCEIPEVPSYVGKDWEDMTLDEKTQKYFDEAPKVNRELREALGRLRRARERMES